jgi:hypothetical protein
MKAIARFYACEISIRKHFERACCSRLGDGVFFVVGEAYVSGMMHGDLSTGFLIHQAGGDEVRQGEVQVRSKSSEVLPGSQSND